MIFIFKKIGRVFKKVISKFSPIIKFILKYFYGIALKIEDPFKKRRWLKRLFYLRQWVHPPRHIAKPQYGIAILKNRLRLKVNLSEMAGGNLFYYGDVSSLDKGELKTMELLIKEGGTVIDVGANMGLYTLFMSRLVGKEGVVYSLEPISFVYKLLENNKKLSSISNIILNRVAVSNYCGNMKLLLNAQSGLTSQRQTMRGEGIIGEEIVECVTLDKFMSANNINRVDFLKIDVEGSEKDVLEGCKKLLEEQKDLILMVELDKENDEINGNLRKEVVDRMYKIGYEAWIIDRKSLRLKRIAGNENNYFGINFIFIKPQNRRYNLLKLNI